MGKPQRHGGTEAAQSFSPCDLHVSVSPWLIRLLDLENCMAVRGAADSVCSPSIPSAPLLLFSPAPSCHLSLVTSKNRAHVLASIAGHLQVAAPGNRTALRRAGDVDAAFPVGHAG